MPVGLSRVVLAGVITGISDGLFSSVLSAVFYGSTVTRLFQGVAATLLGNRALSGGPRTALVGVAMHFGVAFAWSAVFMAITMLVPLVRRISATPSGVLTLAAIYGPMVWLVMSLVVVPALVHRAPAINARWWTQLVGHIVFVGLPIVASICGGLTSEP